MLMPPPLILSTLPQCATSEYRGPIASCLLVPLLPFVSRLLAGCCIACCHLPPPRVTFRRAAAARAHPRPLLFVCASWLSRRISSLRLSTRRRLTTGCVVAVADAQVSSASSRVRLSPSSHLVELASSPLSSSSSTSVAIVVVVVVSCRAIAMVIVVVDVAHCAVAIIVDFAVRRAVAIIIVASSTSSSPVALSP